MSAKTDAEAQADLAEVRRELAAKGYTWFSLDKHHFTEDGTVIYWLNGSTLGRGRGRLTQQPAGWFTLDQLRNEEFRSPADRP